MVLQAAAAAAAHLIIAAKRMWETVYAIEAAITLSGIGMEAIAVLPPVAPLIVEFTDTIARSRNQSPTAAIRVAMENATHGATRHIGSTTGAIAAKNHAMTRIHVDYRDLIAKIPRTRPSIH
jgi:hypothetical protein